MGRAAQGVFGSTGRNAEQTGVHHIRKQNDSDVFNKVSGTTGLTGSADATFVLEKEKRASDTAKLYVTGRDTPYQEYTLRFRDCRLRKGSSSLKGLDKWEFSN